MSADSLGHAAAPDSMTDRETLLRVGRELTEAGDAQKALSYLEKATRLYPDDHDAWELLAKAYLAQDDFKNAEQSYVYMAHYAPTNGRKAVAYFVAAWCNLRLRDASRALKFYVAAGTLPAEAVKFLREPAAITDGEIDRLTDGQATHLLEITYCARHLALARRIAFTLKGRGDNLRTNATLAMVLPTILLGLGESAAAGQAYLEIQRAGGYAADYRPKWPYHHLAKIEPDKALLEYVADRRRFAKRTPEARKPAAPVSHHLARAETLAGGAVGIDGVFLSAVIASTGVGAKYAFEYGPAPDQLTQHTPLKDFPAPRTAVIRQRASRHFEWNPQSSEMSWQRRVLPGDGHLTEAYVLRLTGPFATDRNQLNGMGPHEMLMGMRWAHDPEAITGHDSLGATGGIMDLRNAEFTIVARGENFVHNGTSLTFWAAHTTPAKADYACSQWALTGAPIPDAVLESGQWWRTTLTLCDDPGAWTYTGNNPAEQGARSSRYKRLPLDYTLSRETHPFVLSFAMDNIKEPPLGHVEIAEMELRLCNPSLLSEASGATLGASPAGDDPSKLTNGRRGFDEDLWTSGPGPQFPLEFAWDLRNTPEITHFQFCQHPYWPAKDVEVIVTTPNGAERTICSKALPSSYPYEGQPTHLVKFIEPVQAARVKLRILSGYADEFCGLEGFDVFGRGGLFQGDGEPCHVSTEVTGLTPGAPLFFRVVVQEGENRIAGAVQSLDRPGDRRPVIASAVPLRRGSGQLCLKVRANALGLPTKIWVGIPQADGTIAALPAVELGSQPTARHIYLELDQAPPDGRLTVFAENAEGAAKFQVQWTLTGAENNPLVHAAPLADPSDDPARDHAALLLDLSADEAAAAQARGEIMLCSGAPPQGFVKLATLQSGVTLAATGVLNGRCLGYGDELAAVKAYRARGGKNFHELLHILRKQAAAQAFSPRKVAEMGLHRVHRRDVIMRPHLGQLIPMGRDFSAPFHHMVIQQSLLPHVTADLDCVVDVGCGTGDIIAELAAVSRRDGLTYFGAEPGRLGRRCLDHFAELLDLPALRSVDLDIRTPDFSFLEGMHSVLLISSFSLVYANPFPAEFWRKLFRTVPAVKAVVLEPLSFAAPNYTSAPLFTRERARTYGISEDFLDVVHALERNGELRVREFVPDLIGLSTNSAVSLLHFEKI